jgi:hypothetical protein
MKTAIPSAARPTPPHWADSTGSTPPIRRKRSEQRGIVVSRSVEENADVRSRPSTKPSW